MTDPHENEIMRAVCALLNGEPKPDWVTFFREILGLNGEVRRRFRTPDELVGFYRTDTYADIIEALTRLREQPVTWEDPKEPTRVITVRMPRSLHEALRAEAHDQQTSMNTLCISKLVVGIDSDLVPRERWKRPRPIEPDGAGESPTEPDAGRVFPRVPPKSNTG